MIDPTINFRSPTRYAQPESLIRDITTIDLADSAVQTRAYALYELRGRIDGRAEQDWYQAEIDLRTGGKQAYSAQTYAGTLARHCVKLTMSKPGVVFMVCKQLDQLEWDFMQARAESPDIDSSSGWTDRELACLDAILDHKREGHQGERCLGD